MKTAKPVDLALVQLEDISAVTFFKRDEFTSDLVCCEVTLTSCGGSLLFFHEEMPGWNRLLHHLEQLPGFRCDWRDSVILPPFAENRTVAYRADGP